MEEIEYGEFLRLDGGKIVRYGEKQDIRVENNRYIDYSGEYEWETRIVNHSFNIIDLIEPGDYVNGKEVVYDVYNTDTIDKHKCIEVSISNDNSTTWTIADIEIKSIVTKEQFENAEYKVEE